MRTLRIKRDPTSLDTTQGLWNSTVEAGFNKIDKREDVHTSEPAKDIESTAVGSRERPEPPNSNGDLTGQTAVHQVQHSGVTGEMVLAQCVTTLDRCKLGSLLPHRLLSGLLGTWRP